MPDFSWQVNLFKVLWKLFLFLLYTGDAQQDQNLQDGMQASVCRNSVKQMTELQAKWITKNCLLNVLRQSL